MPASPHLAFQALDDITTPIWRYTDFTKFVAMLNSSALYFSRADLLGDPFEVSLPTGTVEAYKRTTESLAKSMGIHKPEQLMAMFGDTRSMRPCMYVNCWHAMRRRFSSGQRRRGIRLNRLPTQPSTTDKAEGRATARQRESPILRAS